MGQRRKHLAQIYTMYINTPPKYTKRENRVTAYGAIAIAPFYRGPKNDENGDQPAEEEMGPPPTGQVWIPWLPPKKAKIDQKYWFSRPYFRDLVRLTAKRFLRFDSPKNPVDSIKYEDM